MLSQQAVTKMVVDTLSNTTTMTVVVGAVVNAVWKWIAGIIAISWGGGVIDHLYPNFLRDVWAAAKKLIAQYIAQMNQPKPPAPPVTPAPGPTAPAAK